MKHSKPHLGSVHAKVRASQLVQPPFLQELVTFELVQCGATTALLAVSASAGGLIAFRKIGLIQVFPERMHRTLKWLHRNVRRNLLDFAVSSSAIAPQHKGLVCLQLGILTYYSGLLTIEVALTHAAVYKVSLYFAHASYSKCMLESWCQHTAYSVNIQDTCKY